MTNAPLIGAEHCLDAGLALALSETQNEKLRGPRENGWNQNPLSRDVIQQRLSNGSTGYAIITGELSGDVVAVDPDSLEASRIVDLFFPEGPSWGRTVDGETLTRAVLVRCPGASNYEYPKQFELIANGKAIDGPGSVHYETKESRFPLRKLMNTRFQTLHPSNWIGVFVIWNWRCIFSRTGTMSPRNSATMALSACLYRAGVSLAEAERIVRAILILSEDDEPDNRMDVLTRTYTAGDEDKAITAEADLLKLFGKAKFQRVDGLIGLHGAANILGVRVRPTRRKKATPLPKSPGKAETPKDRPKAKPAPTPKPEPDPEPKAAGGKKKVEPLPSDDPFQKECIPLDIYVPVRRPYPTQGLTPKTLKTAEAVAKICKSDLSFAANSVCSVAEFVGSMYYDIELPWTGAIVPATTFRMSFLESGEGKTRSRADNVGRGSECGKGAQGNV